MKNNQQYPTILDNKKILGRIFLEPWDQQQEGRVVYVTGAFDTISQQDVAALSDVMISLGAGPITLRPWGDDYNVYVACLSEEKYQSIMVPIQGKLNSETLVDWVKERYTAAQQQVGRWEQRYLQEKENVSSVGWKSL